MTPHNMQWARRALALSVARRIRAEYLRGVRWTVKVGPGGHAFAEYMNVYEPVSQARALENFIGYLRDLDDDAVAATYAGLPLADRSSLVRARLKA